MCVILLKVTRGLQVSQVQAALPVQATKTYTGGRGIDPLTIRLCTRSRQVAGFVPQLLSLQGNNCQYRLKWAP